MQRGAKLPAPVESAEPLKLAGMALWGVLRFRPSKQGIPAFPDIPSMEEQGIAKCDYSGRGGMAASGRTPITIINKHKLNGWFVTVSKDPEVRRKPEVSGTIVVGSTVAEFRDMIARDTASYRKLVQGGIRLSE